MNNKKTIIYFKIRKGGNTYFVAFDNDPSDEHINGFFEFKCGGVYKWWRKPTNRA